MKKISIACSAILLSGCMMKPFNGQIYQGGKVQFSGVAQHSNATILIEGFDKSNNRWVLIKSVKSTSNPLNLGSIDGYLWSANTVLSVAGGPSVYCMMDANCSAPGNIKLRAREIGSDLSTMITFDDSGQCVSQRIQQGDNILNAGAACRSVDSPVASMIVNQLPDECSRHDLSPVWTHWTQGAQSITDLAVHYSGDYALVYETSGDRKILESVASNGAVKFREDMYPAIGSIAFNGAGKLAYAGYLPIDERGYSNLFKYQSTGDVEWFRSVIELEGVILKDVAIDPLGRIIVAGDTIGFDFQPGVWVEKYASNGVKQWNISELPQSGKAELAAVAIDSTGNVLVLSNVTSTDGIRHMKLRKYNSNGQFVWQFEPDNLTIGMHLATDDANNIYLATGQRASMNSNSTMASKLFKLNPQGQEMWHVHDYPAISDHFVEVDRDGNIVTANQRLIGNPIIRRYDRDGGLIHQTQIITGTKITGLGIDYACHVYATAARHVFKLD